MKVLIIDDHVLFRDGLTSLLESQPEFSVIGQADTIHQGLQLIGQLDPDVILIDLTLPDGNGLEATQKIISRWPDANVVILSIHDSEDFVLSVIRHGAIGFIPKHMPKDHFLAAIKGIQFGEAAITRKMTRRLIQEFIRVSKVNSLEVDRPVEMLTFRELEVFRMLGTGASNREIADSLHIAENTVKSHVHKILDKLKLRSRVEARTFAFRIGQANGDRLR
ncbi:MAG TPA: response regulator transcription factor [Anaerolineaceae bacterium]|nr:response regulator transcription factor [Anaerolineaceae bacterium]